MTPAEAQAKIRRIERNRWDEADELAAWESLKRFGSKPDFDDDGTVTATESLVPIEPPDTISATARDLIYAGTRLGRWQGKSSVRFFAGLYALGQAVETAAEFSRRTRKPIRTVRLAIAKARAILAPSKRLATKHSSGL